MQEKKGTVKVLIWLLKAAVAGVVAFGILNIFSYFYYYMPYNVECTTGATDYVLPANFRGYNREEGFAKIHVDENGYINETAQAKVDVLCMGSSHTLGYNVDTDKNYVSLLNKNFKQEDISFYNIGMFGHEWYYCMKNLEDALDAFRPSQYVMIETFHSKYEVEKLALLNSGNYGNAGQVTSNLMQKIKQVPYFQLAMHQIKNMMSGSGTENISTQSVTEQQKDVAEERVFKEAYTEQLSIALKKAKAQTEEHDCQLIFLYNPNILVDEKGEAYAETDAEYFEIFEELCQKYDILLIDMTEDFLNAYEQDYIIPRGFENTEIGSGHINCYGHKKIADKVQQVLEQELREEKE